MFCFVDFRNRPQYKYTFPSFEKAREYLQKIQNNPLGVTIIHADGRREYFENGLPACFAAQTTAEKSACQNRPRILKGCHVKYKIRPLAVVDGVTPVRHSQNSCKNKFFNWRSRTVSPLFMLGNLNFYTCLVVISTITLFSSYILQKNLSQSALSSQLNNQLAERPAVLGDSDSQADYSEENDINNSDKTLQLADEDLIMNLIEKIDDKRYEDFKKEILKYVKGRPMEDMVPYIAKQPRIVAAFLVGIAMKESKFGTYSPHLGGVDCHNYWGFKGGGLTTSGGYTCFNSPEQAIEIVGKRIAHLVNSGRTNPSEMVIWKCGSTCSWDKPENVRKWIADVGINFYRINNSREDS